jgi:selenocysteine lyase/cysteine desulfurase
MTDFDLDFVRDQFPAFSEPTLQGWAFFENAGGSYPAAATVRRLHEFYLKTKVQPYGPYPASRRAGTLMDESHERLATCLNVDRDEVHFGPSTSMNTYVLANALRPLMAEGDEIVVTNQDHEANSGAWRRLADTGITVREWRVDPQTGHLDPADLDRLLSERTRLVAFPHASNIVAEINPVAEIAAKVRNAGAMSVVDGVAAAPHGLPDVDALGADIYMFSSYKRNAPPTRATILTRACSTSVLPRPGQTMPRSRQWPGSPIISTHSTPATSRPIWPLMAGRAGSTT